MSSTEQETSVQSSNLSGLAGDYDSPPITESEIENLSSTATITFSLGEVLVVRGDDVVLSPKIPIGVGRLLFGGGGFLLDLGLRSLDGLTARDIVVSSGSLGGGALGAVVGAPIGGVGGFALGTAGSLGGGELAGKVYDALAGSGKPTSTSIARDRIVRSDGSEAIIDTDMNTGTTVVTELVKATPFALVATEVASTTVIDPAGRTLVYDADGNLVFQTSGASQNGMSREDAIIAATRAEADFVRRHVTSAQAAADRAAASGGASGGSGSDAVSSGGSGSGGGSSSSTSGGTTGSTSSPGQVVVTNPANAPTGHSPDPSIPTSGGVAYVPDQTGGSHYDYYAPPQKTITPAWHAPSCSTSMATGWRSRRWAAPRRCSISTATAIASAPPGRGRVTGFGGRHDRVDWHGEQRNALPQIAHYPQRRLDYRDGRRPRR